MNTDQRIRNRIFWLSDRINRGHLRSDYDIIKYIIEHNSNQSSHQLRQEFLNAILNHARLSVPYYSQISGKSIQDFPIVNKNIIRNKFESFRTIDKNYREGVRVVTSGSTGTPFSIIHNNRKRQRNSADTIYFGEIAGFTIGQRLYYFKIWNNINKKNKLTLFAQNLRPINVVNLDDTAVAELIKSLQTDTSEKGLLAYSSVYDSICRFLTGGDFKDRIWNIKSIISMAESLSSPTKKSLQYFFNINPVSRYSNVENGIIAQQLPDGTDNYVINDASFYVEIMDINSDRAVPFGVAGRIVVTDLFNYSMPMIRYDTGDIGVFDKADVLGSSRIVLSSIEGRKMDLIYNTSGLLVSSFVITNNMWKYNELRQYQFIQVGKKEYIFKLNTNLPFIRENELLAEFKVYFGSDAIIKIEYVDEIPLLSSGKRKKVVNTCSEN